MRREERRLTACRHLAVRHCLGPITTNSARIYWRGAWDHARRASVTSAVLIGVLRRVSLAIRFTFLATATHRGGDRLDADLAVAIIELGLTPGAVLLFVGEFFSLHDLTSSPLVSVFFPSARCKRPVRQNCALNRELS